MASELMGEVLDRAPEGAWLVRPCEDYKDELRECRRWRSRFHQYFIFGKMLDCSSWQTDYRNCMAYRQTKDPRAVEDIVASERCRLSERLVPHYSNSVWDNRPEPPSDWNAPLPDNLRGRTKESTLYLWAEELKKKQRDDSTSAAASSTKASNDDSSSTDSGS